MLLPNSASIVITAANYNPSIFSKDWLLQNGILTETPTNFVHTPVLSLTETEQFRRVVDEDRLVLTVHKPTQENLESASGMIERVVHLLPETPYTALGFNYRHLLSRDEFNIENMFQPNREAIASMTSETYELGAALIFEFEGFTVRFTILPSLDRKKRLRVNFNFHSDVKTVAEIDERLASQTTLVDKASSIVRRLQGQ